MTYSTAWVSWSMSVSQFWATFKVWNEWSIPVVVEDGKGIPTICVASGEVRNRNKPVYIIVRIFLSLTRITRAFGAAELMITNFTRVTAVAADHLVRKGCAINKRLVTTSSAMHIIHRLFESDIRISPIATPGIEHYTRFHVVARQASIADGEVSSTFPDFSTFCTTKPE